MSTEYKLPYTASEISERLGMVSNTVLYTNQSLTDEQKELARSNIGAQKKITGTAGQFVVIGEDGNVTTRTIVIAEEVAY